MKESNSEKKPRKGDRRNDFTESLIRDTLFDLMETTPIEKITVRRLCEEACINRSTFYLHYRDIRAVAEQITLNYYTDLIDAVSETLIDKSQNAQLALSKMVYGTEYGIKVLRHPEVFIFGEQHELVDQAYTNYMAENSSLSKKEISYFYSFITYGIMGMVKQLLLNGDFYEMIDRMDEIYRSVITDGIEKYLK